MRNSDVINCTVWGFRRDTKYFRSKYKLRVFFICSFHAGKSLSIFKQYFEFFLNIIIN